MANIQSGLTGRTDVSGERSEHVRMTPRDVSDALRLIHLLITSSKREPVEANDHRDLAIDDHRVFPATQRESQSVKGRARQLLYERQMRARHFTAGMFSEPAWDMMLALYGVEDSERRMTITALSEIAGAPLTTALRWLDYLEQRQWINRMPSPTDRRVMFVDLAPLGHAQMLSYLSGIDSFRS